MKKINIKRLIFVSLMSLIVSLLYVFTMCICCYSYFDGKEIVFDIELLYGFSILGYVQTFIGYIILILLIRLIPNDIIKRIVYYLFWIIIFSCIEFYFLILLFHMRRSAELFELLIFIPPFLIKTLFYIYYKYKVKQDYKKTQ